MKKKRNRPPQPDTERKKTQRRLNRAHLLSQGFDGDPEKLVTRWRRGEIRVTIEIITDKEKGMQS